MRPGVLDARTAEEVTQMDLFELFDTDERDDRREARPGKTTDEGQPKGRVRSFFRRWMAAVSEDDDRDGRGRTGDRRRDSSFEFD